MTLHSNQCALRRGDSECSCGARDDGREQIVITITPADDGVRCGECEGPDGSGASLCRLSEYSFMDFRRYRGDICLAAARTLREEREAARRVIEAGQAIASSLVVSCGTPKAREAFDAAVAQYEAAVNNKGGK